MHHANIIINRKDCKSFIFNVLQKDLGFDIKANPDFLMIENESFGIDDARNFGKWVIGKPLLGESKVSLIITKSITHEAQNALLKILEEPSLGTYIFINLESRGGLLPTFLSRVKILNIEDKDFENNILDKDENKNNAYKFLHGNIKNKFSLIQSLSKKTDKTDMKELIKDLEKISYENYTKDVSKAEAMKNMLKAKIFATSRGSSPKMLLEWLSCVV
ncbi:MAG: hypothetical protein NT116_04015 [Candidatus Parcubacteria bacterium]|nr:hypothetical protein [Candidatus Parcubacteria bacterium]